MASPTLYQLRTEHRVRGGAKAMKLSMKDHETLHMRDETQP